MHQAIVCNGMERNRDMKYPGPPYFVNIHHPSFSLISCTPKYPFAIILSGKRHFHESSGNEGNTLFGSPSRAGVTTFFITKKKKGSKYGDIGPRFNRLIDYYGNI